MEDFEYKSSPKTRHKPSAKFVIVKDTNHESFGDDFASTDGFVGFSTIPQQLSRKIKNKSYEFNLMIVGYSGLGKSTLLNALLNTEIYNEEYPGPSQRAVRKTKRPDNLMVLLEESGVKLKLSVIDMPGFGDLIDNTGCHKPLVKEIEERLDEYLLVERQIRRNFPISDRRVHACLYFLSPNCRGLGQLDILTMKALCNKVNLIPLIAKSDTLTPDECKQLKQNLRDDFINHKIQIYEFPDLENCPEQSYKITNEELPLAVVGSTNYVETYNALGTRCRVAMRKYPWGDVEVENLGHNDFLKLRSLLLSSHNQDLKSRTHDIIYEEHRMQRLMKMSNKDMTSDCDLCQSDPFVQLRVEREAEEAKVEQIRQQGEKMLRDKTRERKQQIKEMAELEERKINQLKQQLEMQQAHLDEMERKFIESRDNWIATYEGNDDMDNISMKTGTLTRCASGTKKGSKERKKSLV